MLQSDSSSSGHHNPLTSWLHNITSSIEGRIEGDLSNLESSIAQAVGLEDFYSVHLMDYCEGSYTPSPVPNATLSRRSIHKNVTHCSNRTALFTFDPQEALQATLNKTHLGITLDDLHFPQKIEDGIRALRFVVKGAFVLYCIGIALCLLTLIASSFWTSHCSRGGRGMAALEIVLATLAFLALGIASAIMTAVAVKGTKEINKYGNDIGISATWGAKFQALTWAATALMLVAMIGGCAGCCTHRNREHVKQVNNDKYRL